MGIVLPDAILGVSRFRIYSAVDYKTARLLQALICTLIPFNLEMVHRLPFCFFKKEPTRN